MSNVEKLRQARRRFKIGSSLNASEISAVVKLLDEVVELSAGRCPCCGLRASAVTLDASGLTWCCFEGCNP